MGPQAALGRVAVAGADQLITRVTPAGARRGGDPRRGRGGGRPTAGFPTGAGPCRRWAGCTTSSSVETTLSLGPGWRLVHASGADQVHTTWLKRWTLLDLFLVLVLVIATARLFGRLPAALALLTLVIIAQEPEAPAWIWLAVLVGEALVRALPAGPAATGGEAVPAGRGHRPGDRGAAVLRAAGADRPAPGAGRQGDLTASGRRRPGMCNTVGRARSARADGGGGARRSRAGAPAESDERARSRRGGGANRRGLASSGGVAGWVVGRRRSAARWRRTRPAASAPAPGRQVQALDPNARIQTGPGIPRWQWSEARLTWNGPVQQDAQLRLWLSPPWLTGLLGSDGRGAGGGAGAAAAAQRPVDVRALVAAGGGPGAAGFAAARPRRPTPRRRPDRSPEGAAGRAARAPAGETALLPRTAPASAGWRWRPARIGCACAWR